MLPEHETWFFILVRPKWLLPVELGINSFVCIGTARCRA
jgi:hypothetical protein